MLVIVRHSPESGQSKNSIRHARDNAGDLLLIDDGVFYAMPDALEGFCGTAFALKEHIAARNIGKVEKGVMLIDRDMLEELINEDPPMELD